MRTSSPTLRHAPRPVWQRALTLCFALLMLVAQNWHICEMGGSDCGMPDMAADVWKPKCDKGLKCPCEPPEGAIYSPTGKVLSPGPMAPFDGTCLARLLLGMPGQTPVVFAFDALQIQRVAFTDSPRVLPVARTLPQPPVRGPPVVAL